MFKSQTAYRRLGQAGSVVLLLFVLIAGSVPFAKGQGLGEFTSTQLDAITEHIYRGSALSKACGTQCGSFWSAEQESSSSALHLDLLEIRQEQRVLPRFRELAKINLGETPFDALWKVASTAPKVIAVHVPARSENTAMCSTPTCSQWLVGLPAGGTLTSSLTAPVDGLRWRWKVKGNASVWGVRIKESSSKATCNSEPKVPTGMTIFESTQIGNCENGRIEQAGFLYPHQMATATPIHDFSSQVPDAISSSGWIDPGFSTLKAALGNVLSSGRYRYLSRWYRFHFGEGCNPEATSPCAFAERFQPALRFDTSEQWRPLNVDLLLAEGQHYVCESGLEPECEEEPASGLADLNDHRGEGAYLDIAGTWSIAGDESEFHSPYEECTAQELRDCDIGDRSAIYWRSGGNFGGYEFIDYWMFYRANYYYGAAGFHEGDWEGVTLAPSETGSTFDYASFSQHGTYFSYLRDVLRCEDAPSVEVPAAGTCGSSASPAGERVVALPANGTHANYTTPCSEGSFGDCIQNFDVLGVDVFERGYDGQAPWGRNQDTPATSLIEMPPVGEEAWTDWPGRWGAPNPEGPSSPGNQEISTECASIDNGEGCNPGPRASTAPTRNRGLSPGLTALSCSAWSGEGIAATACNPRELRHAVLGGRVGSRESLTIRLGGARGVAGKGAGIAQYATASGVVPVGSVVHLFGRVTGNTRVELDVLDRRRKREYRARFVVPRTRTDGRRNRLGRTSAHLRVSARKRVGGPALYLGPIKASSVTLER